MPGTKEEELTRWAHMAFDLAFRELTFEEGEDPARGRALFVAATVAQHAKRLGMDAEQVARWLQSAYGGVWARRNALVPGLDLKEIQNIVAKGLGVRRNRASRVRPQVSRVERVFDAAFDVIDKRFQDFGDLELHEDEEAGADNGAGADRQFMYCKDGDPKIIGFAAKAEALPMSRLRGLMRHEMGHALEYRYGVEELEQRLRTKLPATVERRADVIAEAVWGMPIHYDERDVQTIGRGKAKRPTYLPDETAKLKPNGRWGPYFEDVGSLVEAAKEAEPSQRYIDEEALLREGGTEVGGVRWDTDGAAYVVEVPAEKVLFMEGNIWNFSHAAALLEMIEQGQSPLLGLPAARLYRITKRDVTQSRKWDKDGDLSYQMCMERPWEPSDAGTFYVQLVDGNHRALAALAAGESTILVTVGEGYRDDVKRSEWVKR